MPRGGRAMSPAQQLTIQLRGKWHGGYGTARCPAHDDRTPSLSIRDGDRGIIMKCFAGCTYRDIVDTLRRDHWLNDEPRRKESDAERARRELRHAEANREKTQQVRSIWHEARAIEPGDVVSRYLKLRGIDLAPPPSLRFHPTLFHSETGSRLPAMVAGVAVDRRLVAIHRTYLRPDGAKADIHPNKMMLGHVTGGAVRLAPAAEHLAVSEGIETGLSFQQAQGIATWAALSTHGMRTIVLPPKPLASTVYLIVDADEAGEHAAEIAAARFYREDRKVILARPTHGKDMNDSLVALHARSAR